jgi:hypothetical protein
MTSGSAGSDRRRSRSSGEEMMGGRKIAVQKFRIFDGFGEGGFADAAHARKPDDGSLAPAAHDALVPEWA